MSRILVVAVLLLVVSLPAVVGRAAGAHRTMTLTEARDGSISRATTPKQQAIARVTALVRKHARACELTITRATALRTKTVWVVTVAIHLFGRPDVARWNVAGTRVVAADPLAAEIGIGCP